MYLTYHLVSVREQVIGTYQFLLSSISLGLSIGSSVRCPFGLLCSGSSGTRSAGKLSIRCSCSSNHTQFLVQEVA